MGKWVHKLTNLNLEQKTATCAECGDVRIRTGGKDKRGNIIYRCRVAHKNQEHLRVSPWKAFRESTCSKCGFVPENICQLDVDHINGNKLDNSPENLQTLCANCHRLKTYLNNDWDKSGLSNNF